MGGLQAEKRSLGMAVTNKNVNVKSCNYITKLVPTIHEAKIADFGCTRHLIESSNPCEEKTPTVTGIHVGIPNGAVM